MFVWHNRRSVVPETLGPGSKSIKRAAWAQICPAQPSVGCARDFVARKQITEKSGLGTDLSNTNEGRLYQRV